MKALILAGGFGTRLRPLSCTRPKLLFPVCNKPLLDWTLERLAKSKIKEVILAVNYMADAFMQRYGKSTHGMKVFYSRDPSPAPETITLFQRPLRTGGPIKNAETLIGHKEPFLVLNGDIITNIDYAQLMKRHKDNDATATIALYKVEKPSRYGVAELNENNRVVRFIEKPLQGQTPSNLVNAGIYVLEPEIFDFIPSGRPVSIEREVFPKLAEEGKLYGHPFEGLWTDIGEPQDYLKANQLLLNAEIRKSQVGRDVVIESGSEIKDPTIIDDKTTIGEKSKIGPYVALGEYVTVGKGVRIENSIIFPRTIISDYASIRGAIIGEATLIGNGVKIENKCLIGDHAMIQDNVTLMQGVTVCPYKEVSESVLTPKCLM